MSPLANPIIDLTLWSSESEPLTSTAPLIFFLSNSLSSLKSHHTSTCSSVALAISQAALTLSTRLSFLAFALFCNVCVCDGSIINCPISFSISDSTVICWSLNSGNVYLSSWNPNTLGFGTTAAHEAIQSQKAFSAWPLSLHFATSPPSCTKNVASISKYPITLKNSEWLPSSI